MSLTYQSSFTVKTNRGSYKCDFVEYIQDDEHWDIKIEYHSGDVTGSFRLPKTWARTMVFQFIDGLDNGSI